MYFTLIQNTLHVSTLQTMKNLVFHSDKYLSLSHCLCMIYIIVTFVGCLTC